MNPNSSPGFTLLKGISLSLIATAMLLTACGSCPEPEQKLPDGTYTATIAVEDMSNIRMPPDGPCQNAGTFALTVMGNNWGFFQTAVPGCVVNNPSWSGTWKLCGDEATFTQGGSSYTYQWAFDGAELRFNRIDDTDVIRIVYMTTYPWVLQR